VFAADPPPAVPEAFAPPVVEPPIGPPDVPTAAFAPADTQAPQNPVVGPPVPYLAVPPPPPAVAGDPSLVYAGAEPLTPFVHSADEGITETSVGGPFTSVASMATEILSVTPDIPVMAVPEEPESEIITKDVTLIARGRRRKFRLR
jgi:hypothetical protein